MQRAVRHFSLMLARGLFALGMAIPCTGCMATGPMGSATRPNVFILRGMAGYHPGIRQLEERLLDDGVCPTVCVPEAHPRLAERIIAGRNRGRFSGPLVLVGYSYGADHAIDVARRLNEKGMTVDKLVLVEASGKMPVPCNVRECFNIFKSQPWAEYLPILRGAAVGAEGPATSIVNYDVRNYNDGRYDWDNHLTMSLNPYVQELIVDEVMATIEAGPSEEDEPSGQVAPGTTERIMYPAHGAPPPPDP